MDPCLVQGKPLGLVSDGFCFSPEAKDDSQGLVHPAPLGRRVDAEHIGISYKGSGPDPHHHPPSSHVVQLQHAVSRHQRVVVRQAQHSGAQLDVLGPLGSGPYEDFRRRDGLPTRTVVFADPRLIEPQLVQPFDQLHVPIQRQGRIFPQPMEWRHEYSESESRSKSHNLIPS